MGIIRSNFLFIAGTVCGIHVSQNYNVPNIQKFANDVKSRAKQIEERHRKPKKPNIDV